jgi:hypothetical protein
LLRSSCTVVAIACVVLSCSGHRAQAFALCSGCPDLFANTPVTKTPATPAPADAQPRRRVQHAHFHERRSRRRLSHETARFSVADASQKALDSNAAADIPVKPQRPDDTGTLAAGDRPPSPAARIDTLFNQFAAGPSDDPDAVTSFRRAALGHDTAPALVATAGPSDRKEALAQRDVPDAWWIVRFIGGTFLLTAAFSVSGPILWRTFARLPLPGPPRANLRRDVPRLPRPSRDGARRPLTSQRLVG